MLTAVRLGLRLTIGTRGQRTRSLLTAGASALGTAVLLLVWGIAHSQVGTTTAFDPSEVGLLIAGTIGMVALPVLVLVSTVARLSAGLRDRRLANLRLLGMSRTQTRIVAATEAGAASVLGVVVGVLLFFATTPLLAQLEVAGRRWTVGSLVPPILGWICVLLVVPAVSILTAALPQRLTTQRGALPTRPARGRYTILRVAPLILGFLICWCTRSPIIDNGSTLPPLEVVAILIGVTLMGIGTLLVVPVFVRLIAHVTLRVTRRPLALLTARRIESQPAGATRVISALMIGLFIVMAARAVIGAFQATPQYVSAADFIEREQTAEVTAAPTSVDSTTATLKAIQGVDRVSSFPILHGETLGPKGTEQDEVTVVVATCAELIKPTGGHLVGCSDEHVSLVGDPFYFVDDADALGVRAVRDWEGHGERLVISTESATTIDSKAFDRAVGALNSTHAVVVPPDTPGIAALLPETDRLLVAHAGPGRFLYDRVYAQGLRINTMVDIEGYDFVQGMRTLVWTLAAVVLAIGLLTFTVAGIDRALSRRRELTALRLIGTPGSLLRWAQWLEAALPTVLGSLLAIFAGAYAGATYLQLDNDQLMPLTAALVLAAVAATISALLAGITVIGTTARLDPDHIRAE